MKPESWREIERKMRHCGFSIHSQKGSHVKFIKVTGRITVTAIIPRHKTVSAGTLRSALRQAGISPEYWQGL